MLDHSVSRNTILCCITSLWPLSFCILTFRNPNTQEWSQTGQTSWWGSWLWTETVRDSDIARPTGHERRKPVYWLTQLISTLTPSPDSSHLHQHFRETSKRSRSTNTRIQLQTQNSLCCLDTETADSHHTVYSWCQSSDLKGLKTPQCWWKRRADSVSFWDIWTISQSDDGQRGSVLE